jgi:hypothetical protein
MSGKWERFFSPKGIFRVLIIVLSVFMMIPAAAMAFTVTVTDPSGTPVSGFRWLVESDTTQYVEPGVPVSDSISVNIHKSYAPVKAKGHETGSSAVISLPSNERYFVSILPDSGYAMGGTHVNLSETSVTVVVNPLPIPTAQISVFVFVDQRPINNAWDEGEPGIGGATVLITDILGNVVQDAFGNPIGTTYQLDSSTGKPLLDVDGNPIVDQLGTGIVKTLTQDDFDLGNNPYNLKVGEALIKYLPPGKYGVNIVPPHTDDLGSPIGWIQTTTIEGTPTIDAWVKANEPKLFVEGFGTGFNHVAFGFVKTSSGSQDYKGQTFERTPWNDTSPGGAYTISGTVRFNHFSRPPATQGYFPGEPVPDCWVGLNDPLAKREVLGPGGLEVFTNVGLYAAPCNPDSTFTIPDVPPGTYQLVIWDTPLDMLFYFQTVEVTNSDVNLGDVLVFRWFGTLEGSIFLDVDQDGFRDPGETGLPGQAVNLRFRDGTIYQATVTDINGDYAFEEVFPFFKWLVAEVDFARFKATGMTTVVDYGGEIQPDNGWVMPSRDKLNPQPQADINPNTGNNLSRTETGPVLTEAMMLFLNQTNIIDWGKTNYSGDENGGITGIVFYATTRAENDPEFGVGEPWEPGIPRVQVNLYQDSEGDGVIDDLDGDGNVTLADVDNYPFGNFPGTEDVDRNGNGIFDPGDAIQITTTDSWDDNMPTGCIQDLPVIHGQQVMECYDAFGTWNQVRPGIFDGGYAFDSYFPGGMASGSTEVSGLPSGFYIVEAVPPPGYEIVKEEDKNVDFGDAFEGSPLLLPPVCVGEPHTVPDYLSLFPDQMIPAPFAGQQRPLCDRKQITVTAGKNSAADFFFFTEVPKAARVVGFVNNDLAAEFNVNSPNFGEKLAPAWMPVSFRDWAGNEIVRVYTDEFGSYNALLPSTYTVNIPTPSGVSPNMITAVLNDPVLPDGTPDPFYNPTYTITPWTLEYFPGHTTYLDTPVVPMTAFSRSGVGVDTEAEDKTPVIEYADTPETYTGPYLCISSLPSTVTLNSKGLTQVINPEYVPGSSTSFFVTRDYGFGNTSGEVTLNGAPLPLQSWSDSSVTVQVLPGATTGKLMLKRGDNGKETEVGITLHVIDCTTQTVIPVAPSVVIGATPIQDAIDSASAGDIILVAPGNYNENVIMNKPVILQGAGAGGTVINGNPIPLERLDTWHSRINSLGGADLAAFLLKDPFTENEAPTIVVFGELTYPNGNIQNPLPGTKTFNPGNPFTAPGQAMIDGFGITGSKAGSGIFAVTSAKYLTVSNNAIYGNQGMYGGGISIGIQDVGFDVDNMNVTVRGNKVYRNGGIQGGGGISVNEGSHNYLVTENLILGNFSRFNGAGISHKGLSNNGVISRNRILFNENNFGALLARAGDGGGIYVGGDILGGTGSGAVTIDGNLIQGNLAGAGNGAGIMVEGLNGDDVRNNPADPSQWYNIRIMNNIVVNNVAGLAGGGIYLQDAVSSKTFIINNTVAGNDSSATSRLAFETGALDSTPQPAGIVTSAHSQALIDLLTTAGVTETFSSPTLLNNIVYQNRSFFNDASLNGGRGGLAPNPVNSVWDLAVLNTTTPEVLSPQNCLLTMLAYPDGTDYTGNGNLSGDPMFRNDYSNSLAIATVIDEGGNNISVRFTPLVGTTGFNFYPGDYHITGGSPAEDAGGPVDTITHPVLAQDYDSEARNITTPDIGADENTVIPVQVTSPNGGEVLASGGTHVITWSAPPEAVSFDLEYSVNDGTSWRPIATGVTMTSYTWNIPAVAGNKRKARVRVTAYDSTSSLVGTDISDARFMIEVIRITAPNGGESWTRGTSEDITWITNATKTPITKVVIKYHEIAGTGWNLIKVIKGSNPGTYSWAIPTGLNPGQYRLKVNLWDANGNRRGADKSDGTFQIN